MDIRDNALRQALKNVYFVSGTPCGGKTPRNFCIEPNGAYLLVGNQESDSIVVFTLAADGGLREVRRTDFPSPVCIRFFTRTKFHLENEPWN